MWDGRGREGTEEEAASKGITIGRATIEPIPAARMSIRAVIAIHLMLTWMLMWILHGDE